VGHPCYAQPPAATLTSSLACKDDTDVVRPRRWAPGGSCSLALSSRYFCIIFSVYARHASVIFAWLVSRNPAWETTAMISLCAALSPLPTNQIHRNEASGLRTALFV
jgi:cell division FtsZ-interacting protein ZapD